MTESVIVVCTDILGRGRRASNFVGRRRPGRCASEAALPLMRLWRIGLRPALGVAPAETAIEHHSIVARRRERTKCPPKTAMNAR